MVELSEQVEMGCLVNLIPFCREQDVTDASLTEGAWRDTFVPYKFREHAVSEPLFQSTWMILAPTPLGTTRSAPLKC